MLEANSILQDRYRIIKQLGRGGMGFVYEAVDERVRCVVAIKRTEFDTEELVRAFEREARLLANLRHPALPKVMDHFVQGGGQHLVMEYIPGQDLAQMLGAIRRPFAPAEVLRWGDELLRVLEYLHSQSPPILHRDIKPSNLKLTESGEIYLLDFGLAKGAAGQMSTVGLRQKSVAGYTPNYAPLEQILRSENQRPDGLWVDTLSEIDPDEVRRILDTPTDERSDLYSLGATLYHLLTNEPPMHAGRRALYRWKGQDDPVRGVSEINELVPSEVSEIIGSAIALSPGRRPPSAASMRTALRDAGQSLRMHTAQVAIRHFPQEALDALVQRVVERVNETWEQDIGDLGRVLETVLSDFKTRVSHIEERTQACEQLVRAAETRLREELEQLRQSGRNDSTYLLGELEAVKERLDKDAHEIVDLRRSHDEMSRRIPPDFEKFIFQKAMDGIRVEFREIDRKHSELHKAVEAIRLSPVNEQRPPDGHALKPTGQESEAGLKRVETPEEKQARLNRVITEAKARKEAQAKATREAGAAQPPQQPPPPPLGSARRYGAADMDFPVEVAEEEKRYHNEARRFARLLVSEIKLYHEQKVREGRDSSDLYDRLSDEIKPSRQMYDKRVRPEVSSRYDYFHHELVNMLAEGDPSKLGINYPGPVLK